MCGHSAGGALCTCSTPRTDTQTSLQQTRCVFPYDLAATGMAGHYSASHCAVWPASAPAPGTIVPQYVANTRMAPPFTTRRTPPTARDSASGAGHDVIDTMIPAAPGPVALASQDSTALPFLAEMYGLQLDQLMALLGLTTRQSRALVARWVSQRLAESGTLSPGQPWVWLTRSGLRAVGAQYPAGSPALPRLAHLRAVTAVRLALESVAAYRDAGAHWRSERHLRARVGGRVGARDHLPDAEVHWPDAPVPGPPAPWAGECWAIEAELTPKTVARTAAIMREVLTRTGDYGCPVAQARVPGEPARHARVLYLCSPAAAGTVSRARDAIGGLGARVEVRPLPEGAYLAGAR